MCIYSKFWIEWEKKNLAPYATRSSHPWYSQRGKKDQKDHAKDRFGNRSRYRTAFEIDKDRITNSQAFRRLEYKTQVFVTHEGDNYRTRLTHSLEVSEIARHIARALRLNEHLVEAIALGHDLGHAPYGHVAENAINSWFQQKDGGDMLNDYYFCHNRHSVEIVDHLEPGYDWDARKKEEGFARGLNLTNAVREGILVHVNNGYRGVVHQQIRFGTIHDRAMRRLSKANTKNGLFYPGTLEAQVVRISDDLAQRIHDIEDGFRSGLITKEHVKDALQESIEEIKDQIFNKKSIDQHPYLEHKEYKTRISKSFISDIIDLMESVKNNEQDRIGKKSYQNLGLDEIDRINQRLAGEPEFKELFMDIGVIAFLLHMWRDDKHLDHLSAEDQTMARTRVLKYASLFINIVGKYKVDKQKPPAYHIVAFLRGIMLANVIEHSFWNLQILLDSGFRKFHSDGESLEKLKNYPKVFDNDHKYYVAFCIVDGFTRPGKSIRYVEPKADERIYCFEFNNEMERNNFLNTEFKRIVSSNGYHLFTEYNEQLKIQQKGFFVKKISWLNKSENPTATELLKLKQFNDENFWISIESIQIYFTGYKEFCPGSDSCNFANSKNCSDFSKCPFKKDTKYPDINRVINFQDHIITMDNHLRQLIRNRLHNRSRIARMNYMGDKIIKFLLELYYSNPRVMHDRVWDKLRMYQKKEGISPEIKTWIGMPQQKKDQNVFEKKLMDLLKDKTCAAYENNRITLVRRVIEHVAGMTDRFIANEYNRVNQSGREVEIQDETYLFK